MTGRISVQFARKDGLRWCRWFQMLDCEDARWSWSELETRTSNFFRSLDTNPMKLLKCSCQLLLISFGFSLGSSLYSLILNEYIIYLPIQKEKTSVQVGELSLAM